MISTRVAALAGAVLTIAVAGCSGSSGGSTGTSGTGGNGGSTGAATAGGSNGGKSSGGSGASSGTGSGGSTGAPDFSFSPSVQIFQYSATADGGADLTGNVNVYIADYAIDCSSLPNSNSPAFSDPSKHWASFGVATGNHDPVAPGTVTIVAPGAQPPADGGQAVEGLVVFKSQGANLSTGTFTITAISNDSVAGTVNGTVDASLFGGATNSPFRTTFATTVKCPK